MSTNSYGYRNKKKTQETFEEKYIPTYCDKCCDGWIDILDYTQYKQSKLDMTDIVLIPKTSIMCGCNTRDGIKLPAHIEKIKEYSYHNKERFELEVLVLYGYIRHKKGVNININDVFNYFGESMDGIDIVFDRFQSLYDNELNAKINKQVINEMFNNTAMENAGRRTIMSEEETYNRILYD